MIIADTETTGLIQHPSTPLDRQPEIIEFGAIKVDDNTLVELDAIEFFIKPKVLPLPPKITEITNITTEMLTEHPSFARKLPVISEFFLGERTIVAHNCAYDVGMMRLELQRLDRVHKFPWPSEQLCTVEMNMDIRGHRMKLADLFEHVTGQQPGVKHRALDDCRTLLTIVRWMRQHGKI